MRNTTLIQAQSHLALDAEIGLNFQVADKLSLNLGLGSILTKASNHLQESFQPSALETRQLTTQSYQFKQRALHSTSLKVGMTFLLFTDPNIVRTSCDDTYFIDDFSSSDSCN